MEEDSNPFGFEIPNLDDVAASPEDYRDTAEVLKLLADYLIRKGDARRCRLQGRIDWAVASEAEAERYYNKLPQWAKW